MRPAGIAAPTSARCTEIYDDGLRNPFRFAFDPNASGTRFFIDDVGQSTWEEVDEGGKGLDYGWDTREGFCANGSSTSCAPTPAGFTDPLTVYNHSSGCTFITGGAFIPDGIWAPAYDGGYLFADGGCNRIFLMTRDGAVDYTRPFAQTSGLITDMTFLTQGGVTALYYVTNTSSQLHRITLPAPPPTLPVPPPTPVPVTPPITPASALAGRISVAHSVSPSRSASGHVVRHVVRITSTGTAGITITSLHDSRYGDVTKARAGTCALGTIVAVGDTYTCSFAVRAAGRGIISDVLTVTATGGTGEIPAATAAASVDIAGPPCTIVDVKGLGPLAPAADRGQPLQGAPHLRRDAPRRARRARACTRAGLDRSEARDLRRPASGMDAAGRAHRPEDRLDPPCGLDRTDLRRLGGHAHRDREEARRPLPLTRRARRARPTLRSSSPGSGSRAGRRASPRSAITCT